VLSRRVLSHASRQPVPQLIVCVGPTFGSLEIQMPSNCLILVRGVLIASIGLSACKDLERPSAYYPTYAEAVADGAVKRGWIPGFLPTVARELHEQHDLDTNASCIKAIVPTEARAEMLAKLSPLSVPQVQAVDTSCPLKSIWWFDGLIDQQPANDSALHADLYTTGSETGANHYFVAVQRDGEEVYLWSR